MAEMIYFGPTSGRDSGTCAFYIFDQFHYFKLTYNTWKNTDLITTLGNDQIFSRPGASYIRQCILNAIRNDISFNQCY